MSEMYKNIKRFFEPTFYSKIRSAKLVLESTISAIWYDLVPLFALPYLTILIQKGETRNALNLVIILCIFYILVWVLGYFIRVWDFHARIVMGMEFNKLYLDKILLKNNLSIEQIGTGKYQSIVSKGTNAWLDINWYVLYQLSRLLVGIGCGLYLTHKIGNVYLILFIALSLMSGFGFLYFKYKQIKYDKQINDIDDEINSNEIRILMSRQEVIASQRILEEVNKINSFLHQTYKLKPGVAKFDYLADLCVSSLSIVIPLGAAFYILTLDTANISTGIYLSLVYFAARFTNIMYWFVWLSGQMIDRYPQLVKFWKFLDETPELAGYDTGAEFVHRGGEIELRAVDFTYER